jgi:LmbE family N-acetylglucosaminyl deacetylase
MQNDSPKAILHELERLRQTGSVLFIAAHPDDENTELLAYLALGRNYRSAYLSMTRGDGGQNVLGADLGDKLGVARTKELLAARQMDGAKQYFSRAIDFGFSKNYQETFDNWNKQEVLSDMVRVIREFRPDILVTRFSPSPGGTHGHHTASAILATEAFKVAGDPKAFPEQKLEPWQPKRIFWNVSTYQKDKIGTAGVLKIDTTGKDPVSGLTFRVIAGESRAMHKTQGFDQFKLPGGDGDQRSESFQLLDGEPVQSDIMDGVDTSWSRFEGGAEIGNAISHIISKFELAEPAASVPALLELRTKLSKLPKDSSLGESVIHEKQQLLDRILQNCLGLKTETTIPSSDVVPGETMHLHLSANVQYKLSNNLAVRWKEIRFPKLNKEIKRDLALLPAEPSTFDAVETLPKTIGLTQPYWLQKAGSPGLFHVDDPKLIGTAENSPAFPIENVFEIGGQVLVVHDEPVQVMSDSRGNQIRQRMDVIPPVSLQVSPDVVVMPAGTSRTVDVDVITARANLTGHLRLEAPSGWKVEPSSVPFKTDPGQVSRSRFIVTAPKKFGSVSLTASAEIKGVRYNTLKQKVSYPHLPLQLLQPPALVRAVSLDLSTRGKNIGYLPGAGDSLLENLLQMGYQVKLLDDANLTAKDLEDVDAVVIGVRAFNVRDNIGKAMPVLFTYVENGGTVISQYNRPDKLKTDKIAPYDLSISPERVTDEKAEMTILAPESPVLNYPNKITKADFDGWVQERGLYFPNKWDDHFTPVLACNDAGEAPSKGVLLVAKYGKGHYIYTGLGFFRQLPAGVPGAYRLFANMVSMGK